MWKSICALECNVRACFVGQWRDVHASCASSWTVRVWQVRGGRKVGAMVELLCGDSWLCVGEVYGIGENQLDLTKRICVHTRGLTCACERHRPLARLRMRTHTMGDSDERS